ncbi:hypothetical protein [Plantibacter sp. T3]|uniref:hypothetical protein n=1 Tax=Plantibacter sp. T3 TaxID=2653161 RepID=UPI001358209F|nr:hypothetical protein [Plantibacter sp. T3]
MTPTPTPSPIVEQITAVAAAPWWGVPVTAGVFLLLGGVLTFLFTRWNESTKYKREKQREDIKELVELGAQLVNVGNAVRDFAAKGIGRPTAVFAPMVATEGTKLMDDFQLVLSRFRLVYPNSMHEVLTTYLKTTIVTLLPPYADAGQEWAIHEQKKASARLVDALRALQGHQAISADVEEVSTVVADATRAMAVLNEEIENETAEQKSAP